LNNWRARPIAEIRAFGVDLIALERSQGGLFGSLRGLQIGLGFAHRGLEQFLVQLGQKLALVDRGAVVDIQFFDDAAGLGLDLDRGTRFDLAGGYDAAGDAAALDGGDFGRIDLIVGFQSRPDTVASAAQQNHHNPQPDQALAPFSILSVFSI
jgi:hypothetical protein